MVATKDDEHPDATRTLFWVELVCAYCSGTTAGTWTYGRVPIKKLKKQAEGEGWTFGGVHAFCSPRCRASHIVG